MPRTNGTNGTNIDGVENLPDIKIPTQMSNVGLGRFGNGFSLRLPNGMSTPYVTRDGFAKSTAITPYVPWGDPSSSGIDQETPMGIPLFNKHLILSKDNV